MLYLQAVEHMAAAMPSDARAQLLGGNVRAAYRF
jgi:hypothetical protein